MSVNVIVTGLPSEVIFPKLVYTFKGILKKIYIKKFWIRELTEAYHVDGKQMTVEFLNNADARKARSFLHNLPFVHGNMEYQLKAQMGDGGKPNRTYVEKDWGQGGQRRPKRERPRSRSPGYGREASKLDMEIELLRKQRLVIEEERRLLLEQKKLEMIREYGPSAMREFDDMDAYEPPRKRRHPEPVQAKWPPNSLPPKRNRTGPMRAGPKALPLFVQPCKKLITDMIPFIEKDTTSEEAVILRKLIRAAIRKSLAVALEGKEFMPTAAILNLYREKHPKSDDEKFVAKILAVIRASHLSDTKVNKDGTKPVKEESGTENQKNVKKEYKDNEGHGDHVTNDKIVTQETPANEDGTGAASDLGIQVKSEPNATDKVTEVAPQPLEKVSGEVSKLPEKVSEEVSQPPEKVSEEVSQPPGKVSEEVSQPPGKVSEEVSQPQEKVSEEVSQPPEKVSEEVSQPPEKVSEEDSQISENVSKEVSQESENVSGGNSAEAVSKINNAEEFDNAFPLDDTEAANDLLTEGDLQDADDWVEEQ